MPHILSRLTRFSPYFSLPFIGATLPHRVTIGRIASVSWFFIFFCYYAHACQKIRSQIKSFYSFLINLNWVKPTAEFSIRSPTWTFLPIIQCLISGLYVPLTTAPTLYAGRGGEEVVFC